MKGQDNPIVVFRVFQSRGGESMSKGKTGQLFVLLACLVMIGITSTGCHQASAEGAQIVFDVYANRSGVELEGLDETSNFISYHGRLYRGFKLGESGWISWTMRIPEQSQVRYGLILPPAENSSVSITLTLSVPMKNVENTTLQTIELESDPYREIRRFFHIDLDEWSNQYAEIRIEFSVSGFEHAKPALVEPAVLTSVREEVEEHQPDRSVQDLQANLQKAHIITVLFPGLSRKEFKKFHQDEFHGSDFLTSTIRFSSVYPSYTSLPRTLASITKGTLAGKEDTSLVTEVFHRSFKDVIWYVDNAYSNESWLGQGRIKIISRNTGSSLPGTLAGLPLEMVRAERKGKTLAALLVIDRTYLEIVPKLLRQLNENRKIFRRSYVVCVFATGHVDEEEGVIEPGFFACKMPSVFFIPAREMKAPVSTADILPTIGEMLGISMKDLKFQGRGRLHWLFRTTTPHDQVIRVKGFKKDFVILDEWIGMITHDGEVIGVRAENMHAYGYGNEAFEAYLQKHIKELWHRRGGGLTGGS